MRAAILNSHQTPAVGAQCQQSETVGKMRDQQLQKQLSYVLTLKR